MKTTINTIATRIENAISMMQELSNNEGWVVESSDWVNVTKGGINDTTFAPICPLSAINAEIFATKEDALKHGVDYYLVDMNDKPIQMIITKASEFFKREIKKAEDVLELIRK